MYVLVHMYITIHRNGGISVNAAKSSQRRREERKEEIFYIFKSEPVPTQLPRYPTNAGDGVGGGGRDPGGDVCRKR